MKDLAIVILAAGQSTRMKSKRSKVLHPLAGLPVISYPVREGLKLKPEKIVLVIGKDCQKRFEEVLPANKIINYCIQSEALGTGDAVSRSENSLKSFKGYILILPGDVPLIAADTLKLFYNNVVDENADCAIISTMLPDPAHYGRVVRNEKGDFTAIREFKDASDIERSINEINTGIFLVRSNWLYKTLKKVKPHNKQKEYYLTDLIELAIKEDKKVFAHLSHPPEQFLGINDRYDLSYANKIMTFCICEKWMSKGVSILDPDQTYIDYNVKIGADTTIAPFVFLKGDTRIGKNCIIDAGVILKDVVVGDNVHIKPYSVLEKSTINEGGIVGPFSRVRPDSVVGKNSRVGNFVEIKKSVLKEGVKANHLSYIGDTTIGSKTNVGCGTITCNYDGAKKHKTIIGEEVLIGSDVQFIAPVKIGKGSVIGAGSTITKNVPPDALAVSRAEQVNVKDWAKDYKKRIKK